MNIIFVCTGNTCRSPMAEYYLKSKNLDDVSVISCGFSDGETVNPNSVAVMSEIGIDISNHISRFITPDELINADAILCMTESHRKNLLMFGAGKDKILVLGSGIDDPFGGDLDIYRACRDDIIKSIDQLIKQDFFNTLVVRDANVCDISDIAKIEKACFSTPWSENAIRESMDAGTSFLVAVKQNKIAGYMGLSKIAGEGYVTNVAVLPEFRKQGIGNALIKHVISDCENELEFISLEVRVSNHAAISLYEKFGFAEVGRRKRFYTHPDEDAIIMTKNFI